MILSGFLFLHSILLVLCGLELSLYATSLAMLAARLAFVVLGEPSLTAIG